SFVPLLYVRLLIQMPADSSRPFFFAVPPPPGLSPLSLHDALPIYSAVQGLALNFRDISERKALEAQLRQLALHDPLTQLANRNRSEEHTSELQSPCNLVCRLLLEKKKQTASWYRMSFGRESTRRSL